MRLSGISGFATTGFCALKRRESAPEPKLHNPHNFKIETATDSYGGIEYYIDGYDENARQAATIVKFNNESTKNKQKILSRTLKELYEQPMDTFAGCDE